MLQERFSSNLNIMVIWY